MNLTASPPTRKLELLVLQPTSYCNLNCSYCYLPDRQVQRRMPVEVLERTFQNVLQSNFTDDNLIVLWHAGEPTTVGLPFFETACALAAQHKRPSMSLTHSLQTNATLLNDAWCEFLRRERFEVGVSLDGPQPLHDAHRRNWNGNGSFARVMTGVRKLQQHQVDFGVLTVLTADSIDDPDGLYDFFQGIGATSVAFNIEEAEHVHLRTTFAASENHTRALEKYRRFFHRLLERVHRDSQPLRIREIEQLLKITVRIQTDSAYVYEPMEAFPLRILTVLHNGDVSPYSPELAGMPNPTYQNFRIGNFLTDTLEDVASRLNASRLAADIAASREVCQKECAYFQLCGGTYFSNKLSERGTLLASETQACRFHSKATADAYFDYMGA